LELPCAHGPRRDTNRAEQKPRQETDHPQQQIVTRERGKQAKQEAFHGSSGTDACELIQIIRLSRAPSTLATLLINDRFGSIARCAECVGIANKSLSHRSRNCANLAAVWSWSFVAHKRIRQGHRANRWSRNAADRTRPVPQPRSGVEV